MECRDAGTGFFSHRRRVGPRRSIAVACVRSRHEAIRLVRAASGRCRRECCAQSERYRISPGAVFVLHGLRACNVAIRLGKHAILRRPAP